jgi:hypothetical protein
MVVIGLGLLWLVGQRRRLGWSTDLGLISFMAMAAFGVWWGLSAGWMLFGAVTTLAAWDLDRFNRRLASIEPSASDAQLWRNHLQGLLPVAGLGLLLGGLALNIRLELALGWVILLGLLVIFSLSQVIGAGRAEND